MAPGGSELVVINDACVSSTCIVVTVWSAVVTVNEVSSPIGSISGNDSDHVGITVCISLCASVVAREDVAVGEDWFVLLIV